MPNNSDYSLTEQVFDILNNNTDYSKRLDFFWKYDIEYNGDDDSIEIYESSANPLDRKPVLKLKSYDKT